MLSIYGFIFILVVALLVGVIQRASDLNMRGSADRELSPRQRKHCEKLNRQELWEISANAWGRAIFMFCFLSFIVASDVKSSSSFLTSLVFVVVCPAVFFIVTKMTVNIVGAYRKRFFRQA